MCRNIFNSNLTLINLNQLFNNWFEKQIKISTNNWILILFLAPFKFQYFATFSVFPKTNVVEKPTAVMMAATAEAITMKKLVRQLPLLPPVIRSVMLATQTWHQSKISHFPRFLFKLNFSSVLGTGTAHRQDIKALIPSLAMQQLLNTSVHRRTTLLGLIQSRRAKLTKKYSK